MYGFLAGLNGLERSLLFLGKAYGEHGSEDEVLSGSDCTGLVTSTAGVEMRLRSAARVYGEIRGNALA